MFWSNVWTVFTKEVRDSLRDRRAVISMFVVPTLVMPLLLLVAGVITAKVVQEAQSEASRVNAPSPSRRSAASGQASRQAEQSLHRSRGATASPSSARSVRTRPKR